MSQSTMAAAHPKKHCANGNWSWKALRKNIFHAVLYSTEEDTHDGRPAKEGIDSQVMSLIRLYHADYTKLPIPMLQAFLKKIAKKKNSYEWMSFVHKHAEKAVPAGLPRYKKENGSMIKLDDDEDAGMPRLNPWKTSVNFRVTPALGKHKKRFIVEITEQYSVVHSGDHIARVNLDTYAGCPMYRLSYTREGCLTQLLKDRNFLFHLRDIILTSLPRVKRQRFCKQPAIKGIWGAKKKQYSAFCGARVPEGCDKCRGCFQKQFSDFITDL